MFYVGKPAVKDFIDRRRELSRLLEGVKLGQSYALIAPRRYGKTSLILKALETLAREGDFFTVYVDVMRCGASWRALAEGILDAVYENLGLEGFVRRLRHGFSLELSITLKYKGLEVEPSISLLKGKDDRALLEHALSLPDKVASKKGKKAVVAIDEVGELSGAEPEVLGFFRALAQRQENTVYLFAGSQESIMKRIFADTGGVFYQFANLLFLEGLDKQDFHKHMVKSFGEQGLEVSPEVLEETYTLLRGNPHYTKKLAHLALLMCKKETREKFDMELLARAMGLLLEEERPYLELLVEKLHRRKHAVEVVRAVALGDSPYSAVRESVSRQRVSQLLKSLELDGFIKRLERGKYILTDPVLELYFKYSPS